MSAITNIIGFAALGLSAVILVAGVLRWWFNHYMDKDYEQ